MSTYSCENCRHPACPFAGKKSDSLCGNYTDGIPTTMTFIQQEIYETAEHETRKQEEE